MSGLYCSLALVWCSCNICVVVKEIRYDFVMSISNGSRHRGTAPFRIFAVYIYSDVDQDFYGCQISVARSHFKFLF